MLSHPRSSPSSLFCSCSPFFFFIFSNFTNLFLLPLPSHGQLQPPQLIFTSTTPTTVLPPLPYANNTVISQQPSSVQPLFPPNNPLPMVLRACCGNNCEEFQRPEEMYGIMCCGDEPSNQFEEICCDNVPRRRRQPSSFIDRCCGNQTLAYDQTCCQGVVHNIPSGECCGRVAYPRNSFNTLCCEDSLITNVDPSLTCCGKKAYDGGKVEMCCGGSVYLKTMFDGCCALWGTNPPEYERFRTQTHQCCDRPVERFGPTKCCYLREPQGGRFAPTSYDSTSQCCTFPFREITAKNDNQTCTTPP